ncbi:12725_t:CDS:2 [Dentiscutata erythropus]|uniref:12725_t:CDS:1 n=1 Tax=Dentiscutata erythropus TaxID=1348616 RepID=A0A9N9EXR7_9GLOM|nr:12725_t:CDS:2 [Dentiscutata erythropus]
MSRPKKQQVHLRNIRKKQTFSKRLILDNIQSHRHQIIKQVIKDFNDLNDDDFNLMIKQIKEIREIYRINNEAGKQKGEIYSTYLQLKAAEFINSELYKKTSLRIQSLSMQVTCAKKKQKKHISKIRSAIQKAKQVQPNQFHHMAKKLFKKNKKVYTAEFVKLVTDISNMGVISIQASVDCTKAMYKFLTGDMPTHWISPSIVAKWNKDIAALLYYENQPNQNTRIQISGSNNRIENITQEKLQHIRKELRNSDNNIESENFTESAQTILDTFLVWRH